MVVLKYTHFCNIMPMFVSCNANEAYMSEYNISKCVQYLFYNVSHSQFQSINEQSDHTTIYLSNIFVLNKYHRTVWNIIVCNTFIMYSVHQPSINITSLHCYCCKCNVFVVVLQQRHHKLRNSSYGIPKNNRKCHNFILLTLKCIMFT